MKLLMIDEFPQVLYMVVITKISDHCSQNSKNGHGFGYLQVLQLRV